MFLKVGNKKEGGATGKTLNAHPPLQTLVYQNELFSAISGDEVLDKLLDRYAFFSLFGIHHFEHLIVDPLPFLRFGNRRLHGGRE